MRRAGKADTHHVLGQCQLFGDVLDQSRREWSVDGDKAHADGRSAPDRDSGPPTESRLCSHQTHSGSEPNACAVPPLRVVRTLQL
eukprot:12220-Eustigmatos_ZCMA.PRE.1